MDSLEELSAKQLINDYPLPLVEKIVKYGSERIKKENEREVIIKFTRLTDIPEETLNQFISDMKIPEIIYGLKNYDIKFRSNIPPVPDIRLGFVTLERCLKYEESKQLIELLKEYPQYRKYFIFAKCYKGDYIGIFFNQVGMYAGHVIEDNFNNLMFDYINFRILYQVDW